MAKSLIFSNFAKHDKCKLYENRTRPIHIGRFWSGCAQAVKHGLEIMGIGLIDIDANDCIMLRAHQSLANKELGLRDKSMTDFYISVIKRYRKVWYNPNRTLISKIFKDLSCLQRKTA